jgi:hypothetical protein
MTFATRDPRAQESEAGEFDASVHVHVPILSSEGAQQQR